MLLYDAFVKLHIHSLNEALAETDLAFLLPLNFSAEDVEEAEDKKISAFRSFAFDLKGTEPGQLNAMYDEFLTQCKLYLLQERVTQASVLPVILNTLEAPEYRLRCVSIIEYMLVHEENAAALVSLSYQFIDNSNAFFACVKWMLQHGVTPETLLSTHLIQNYVRYHMMTLGSEDNAVIYLHQLLLNDAITHPLALQMSTTRCSEDEISYMALDGKRYNPSELTTPEKVVPAFVFTDSRYAPQSCLMAKTY